jgi:hypothetical protein
MGTKPYWSYLCVLYAPSVRREQDPQYGGMRVTLAAYVTAAKLRLQLDIGTEGESLASDCRTIRIAATGGTYRLEGGLIGFGLDLVAFCLQLGTVSRWREP